MDNLDSNIFGDKKLKDLFQEIYTNQKKKEKQISTLIEELKPMVESIGDATLIVPLLKEYLEIEFDKTNDINTKEISNIKNMVYNLINDKKYGTKAPNSFRNKYI
jgi:hypothetical protein